MILYVWSQGHQNCLTCLSGSFTYPSYEVSKIKYWVRPIVKFMISEVDIPGLEVLKLDALAVCRAHMFTCWISFAPVFSFIYCWVLIFALSSCYILIYMF